IAEKDPDALVRRHIEPSKGFGEAEAESLAAGAGVPDDVQQKTAALLTKLYEAFNESDATLFEVNPLVVTKDRDVTALDSKVIISDEKVVAILFNIFGGITRGDEIAKGIIEASQRIEIGVPLVVRLDGTNSEEGLGLLADADIPNLHLEKTMLGAAERVVELAGAGAKA